MKGGKEASYVSPVSAVAVAEDDGASSLLSGYYPPRQAHLIFGANPNVFEGQTKGGWSPLGYGVQRVKGGNQGNGEEHKSDDEPLPSTGFFRQKGYQADENPSFRCLPPRDDARTHQVEPGGTDGEPYKACEEHAIRNNRYKIRVLGQFLSTLRTFLTAGCPDVGIQKGGVP